MATTPEKLTVPAGTDSFTPRQAFRDMANSVRSIVPVANSTDRDAVYDDMVSEGRAPSVSNPLFVWRADTDTIERHNGTGWLRVGTAGDNTWSVPTLSGLGGPTPVLRQVGQVCEIYSGGNITGSFPVGLTELVAPGAIPPELAPNANRWGGAFLSANHPGSVVVRPDGSMAVVHQSGGTRTQVQFGFTWLLS